MEKTLFTKSNVSKFFTTVTANLPAGPAGLVKTLGDNYGANAIAVLDSTPEQFAQPIIGDMLGSYSKGVSIIVHGWGGNA
jgi:hypothetical protein